MNLVNIIRPILGVAAVAGLGLFSNPSVTHAAPPPRPVPAPQILVTGANAVINSNNLPDNLNGTDFGRVSVGTTETRAFSVFNTGDADLVVTAPVTISGSHAAQFITLSDNNGESEVITNPTTTTVTIKPRHVMRFELAFSPVAGENNALLEIYSNANPNPYSFTVKGQGIEGAVNGHNLKLVKSNYKTYKVKGKYPRLGVRVKGVIELCNLTVDTTANAVVRTYVSQNPYLDSTSLQISEIYVKNIKGKVNKKGINKIKKASFKALVPELYQYVISEVVPADLNGQELLDTEINFGDNRSNWKYGWLTDWQYGHNLPGTNWTWGPFYRFTK